MSVGGSPAWDYLPHDPQSFFGLSEDFDRKDLKRSYNRLLKQFKPEKHPTEFQRIREAYERLDQQLRYGRAELSPSSRTRQQDRWSDGGSSTRSSDRVSARRGTPPSTTRESATVPLHQRLATDSPKALYAELTELPDKRPYDFYALAVLSDTLENKTPTRFLKWILAGLREFPDEPALMRLLYCYLRGPVPERHLPALLQAVSGAVRDDWFYFLTEPLWDRLLRSAGFEAFQRTLRGCEAKLSGFEIARKLTFYVHILCSALWTAPSHWIAGAFELLEDNYHELPPQLEADVEFLFLLREYLAQRDEFLNGDLVRERMDEALFIYCTGDVRAGERSFVRCQVELAISGPSLLDAFTLEDDEPVLQVFVALWHLMLAEFAERAAENEEVVDHRTIKVRPLLRELEQRTDSSWLGRLWSLSAHGYNSMRFLVFPAVFCLLYFPVHALVDAGLWLVIWFLVSCVLSAFGGVWLNSKLAKTLWGRWCLFMGRRCYEQIWRPELQQYMGRTFIPFPVLLERIHRIDGKNRDLVFPSWMLMYAQNDLALSLYASAQAYVA